MTSTRFGYTLLSAALSLSTIGYAVTETDLDPDYFTVPPGISTAVQAARARPQTAEVYEAELVGVADGAKRGWFTVMRGSDIPGFNDQEVATAQTAIPTSQGVKVILQNPAESEPLSVITLTGYVKGSFLFDHHNDLGDGSASSYVRIGGKNSKHVRIHARESRFRIKSSTDTRLGKLRTWLEGDFWGGGSDLSEGEWNPASGNQLVSSSSSFRLRHAWGEWDVCENTTLGFGQWWSTWTAYGFTPTCVDFNPPEGDSFQRGAQFVIRHRLPDTTLTLSLHNPETDIRSFDGTPMSESLVGAGLPAGATDKMPDITAVVEHHWEKAWVKLASIVRLLSIDPNLSASIATENDNRLGWGLFASLRVNACERLALFANGIVGDGIGRWLNGNFFNSGTVNPAGTRIHTHFAWSGHGGFTWDLNPEWQVNGWYAYWHNSKTPAVSSIMEASHCGLINMIWSPLTYLQMGFEAKLDHARRRAPNERGARTDANLRVTQTTAFFF